MRSRWTYWLLTIAVGALLVACASIGSPEGGPRDYTPPQVLKSTPAEGTVNFKGRILVPADLESFTLTDN